VTSERIRRLVEQAPPLSAETVAYLRSLIPTQATVTPLRRPVADPPRVAAAA